MATDDVRVDIPDKKDVDTNDLTAPFYETEAFDSIWQALTWKQIRTRIPVCFKKTLRNRYMLANLVYLGYAIGILIIDFNPNVNGTADTTSSSDTGGTSDNTTVLTSILDQSVGGVPLVNKLYLGLGIVHLVSAFLYWWAWKGRSSFDVIMIPEYLNHIEAALYIWSAAWYPKENTLGDYYTLGVHKIEMTAATVELVASFGWIMSWYMTYTRTLGRGFTLDDPDVIAFSATTISSIIYMVYNIQINVSPEQYGTNYLYTNGDIVYFVGACYYIFACLRDDSWFWFLPFAGQYGVAAGQVKVDTKVLPKAGLSPVLMTDPCRRRHEKAKAPAQEKSPNTDNDIVISFH